MSSGEILTLQFGHYTNYVGAHFWNLQDISFDFTGTIKKECNHEILFREGVTLKGKVYTPRLLLCDLKGSLGTLSCSGGLPEKCNNNYDVFWENFEKIEESPAPKNKYSENVYSVGPSSTTTRQSSNCINTWTDFLNPSLHSRSINILKEYCHCSDYTNTFDIFNIGKTTWNSYFGDEFTNNIRKYVEECDRIQGFHVNFDCTDGFSGLALGCMEHLTDEYYTEPILAHPIIASYYRDNSPKTQEERDFSHLKDIVRLTNILLSVKELTEYADFFVPLCTGENGWRQPGNARFFEYINYDPKNYYHSSAILASALDTLSQKYRGKTNYTIADFCADMTCHGRKMAAASIGIPFVMQDSEYLIDCLHNKTEPLYTSITPSCNIAPDNKMIQFITVRGIPECLLKAPLKPKEKPDLSGYSMCRDVKEMFDLYFQADNYLSETNITVREKPLELKNPYPKFFSGRLNKYGFINSGNKRQNVESCPVIAGYHNGNFLIDMIENLLCEASNIKFHQLYRFSEEGLEASEYQETLEKLAEFREKYEENDDEDDDDDDDNE